MATSGSTRRMVFAGVGILTLALWIIQLINLGSIDYKQPTRYSNTVNPGGDQSAPALNGNVWLVIMPFIFLTLLVMFSLVRWAIANSSKWWMAHLVIAIATIATALIVVIAVSIVVLIDDKWKKSNNLASDDRLCCFPAAVNTTDFLIPGCPVLLNACSLSDSTSAQKWNTGFLTFFILLFFDIVLPALLVFMSMWMGTESEEGKDYEIIQSVEQGFSSVAAPTVTSTRSVLGQGAGLSLTSIYPMGVATVNGKASKQY